MDFLTKNIVINIIINSFLLIIENNNICYNLFVAMAIASLDESSRRSRYLPDIYITDKCTEFITFTSVDVFHPRFSSGPFQSLRTLDALSRCNVSGIARSSVSLFHPSFCLFDDARHVQRNHPSANSYTFSLSSRERII